MNEDKLRQQFIMDGFVFVPDLFTAEEVDCYRQALDALVRVTHYPGFGEGNPVPRRGRFGHDDWHSPDGVSQTQSFWPLLTHPPLLSIVRALLGDDVRYLQHSDLSVSRSPSSWHRDNVDRRFGSGPDWNERDEPYHLVRIAIFLQPYCRSRFQLGFIPGSHRAQEGVFKRRLHEALLGGSRALHCLFPSLPEWPMPTKVEWLATEPGDCVIYDPRTLHAESHVLDPRYAIRFAYGRENRHFYRHLSIYGGLRPAQSDRAVPSALLQRLVAADLHPRGAPVYPMNSVSGVPAQLQTIQM